MSDGSGEVGTSCCTGGWRRVAVGSWLLPPPPKVLAKGKNVFESSFSDESAASSSSSRADWSNRAKEGLCCLNRGGRLNIWLLRMGFDSMSSDEEELPELISSAADGELGLAGRTGSFDALRIGYFERKECCRGCLGLAGVIRGRLCVTVLVDGLRDNGAACYSQSRR